MKLRSLCAMLLALALLVSVTALSEGSTWTCPTCHMEGITGNTCPRCATWRPEGGSAEEPVEETNGESAEEPAQTSSLFNALEVLEYLAAQTQQALEPASTEDTWFECEIQSLHHFAGEDNGLKLNKMTAIDEDEAFAMEFSCSHKGLDVVAAYVRALEQSGDLKLNDEFCGVFYTEEDTNGDGVEDLKAHHLYAAALDYTGDANVNGRCSVDEEYGGGMEGHVVVTVGRTGNCQVRAVYDLYMGDCGLRYDPDAAEPIQWQEIPVPENYIQTQYEKAMVCIDSENYEDAALLFEIAASAGHAESAYWLGYLYENGLGVEQDSKKAAKYYQKAADGGYMAPSPTAAPAPTPTTTQAASEAEQSPGTSADTLLAQDLYSFAGHAMSFEMISKDSAGNSFRIFKGSADDLDILKAYFRLLDEGDYPFALNHVYERSYTGPWYSPGSSTYYSATLNYTGTGKVVGGKIEQQYDEDYSGNIMLYCVIDGNSMKGYIYLSRGLEFEDLGLRSDGSVIQLEQVGMSADIGLVEEAGGIYATTDGRLRTSLGQCMVLRDGETYTTDEVSLTRNNDSEMDEFRIYNFYRNEGIAFTVPLEHLMTGDKLTAKEMGVERTYEENVQKMEGFFGWRPNYKFGVCHNGDYLFAHPDPINDLRQLQIRVLKWDETEKIAVVYIACKFDTAPYELEALAAMRIQEKNPDQNSDSQGGGTSVAGSTNTGGITRLQTKCTTCHGNREVDCSQCEGHGGKWVYSQTPNFGGSTKPNNTARTWEKCFKCRGTGKIECTHCHGSGMEP